MFVFLLALVFPATHAQDCKFKGWDFSEEFSGATLSHGDPLGLSIDIAPCNLVSCPASDVPPSFPTPDATAVIYSSFDSVCYLVLANLNEQGGGEWSFKNGKNKDDGIMLSYENGDNCFDGFSSATMDVTFICDDTAPPIETFVSNNQCHWDVFIASETVCKGDGLSNGWIFTIVVLTSITAYFLFGCIFMWRFKGTQIGPESVPNGDFWRSLPGLVKDGAVFTWEKIRGDKYKTFDEDNSF